MADRKAFTLIELLVVIAIIAILSVVVILTLNPAELLRQSRDSNRVSDMTTLSNAISLYSTDQGGGANFTIGTANTIYVSVPDPTATSTAGDQCQGLGLPTIPANYSYHCAATSTYRNVNGTGWMPVNLTLISSGAPIGNLPVDPTNNTSSRFYYTYATNGNTAQFEFTSPMESLKYKVGGSADVISPDGGTLATTYEKGTKLGLEPLDYGDTSLIAYWPLNEGAGTVAYDSSGNGNNGTWQGTPMGTNGFYSIGSKLQPYVGTFNGNNDDIVSSSSVNFGSNSTVLLWFKENAVTPNVVLVGVGTGTAAYYIGCSGTSTCVTAYNGVSYGGAVYVNDTNWHSAAYVNSGGTLTQYLDGVNGWSGALVMPSVGLATIGYQNSNGAWPGVLSNIRIYNRALSAAEVKALYLAGK